MSNNRCYWSIGELTMYYITEVDSNDSVRSFPFIIDIKPTKHKQMCAVCKE